MDPISCTRIIGNKYNRVRAAAITATAQRPSTQLYQLSAQRAGNGTMALSGPFTGAQDSVVDVEVLGGSAGALRASAPVITGVGNGALTVASIDGGAAAQTLSFTLLDAGTQPRPALLDFFGVQLAARATGALGNAVHLSVTRNLTFTDLPYATLEKLTTGTNTFDGPQFDWGQSAATGADIPDGALRMVFKGLPTVHRAWKVWDSGRFVYKIDPPLAYDVPENTRIREVNGDYTLTVTDGVDTEVYTAVTMYDFLAEVQARSALIQVLGVVAQDRAPGGQAVTDIPLRTDAHALPVIASATRGGATLQVGTVSPSAATQNITITCLGNVSSSPSGQAWSVVGGVDGTLPAAYTGVPYADGPVQFTIPQPSVSAALAAAITGRFSPTSRDKDEGLPAICFKPLLLGTAATNKEVTFEYRKRPPDECSCSTARPLQVNLQCLGLDPAGADAMDIEYQTRLISLFNWHSTFVASNLSLIGFDQADVDTALSCTGILADALAEIYDVPAAASAWDGVFTAYQAELAPYANLGEQWGLKGGVSGGTGSDPWTPRAMTVGKSYTNPVNGHQYTVTGITINGSAVTATPPDATLPIASSAVWLSDGSTFAVAEVTDVVLTVTDMGPVKAWGDFAVGRVYSASRYPEGADVEQVRITTIKVGGVSAPMPTYAITWDASEFNGVGVLTGKQTDSPYETVEITSVRVAPAPPGATVALGHEIVNSITHRGYRVDAIEVATVSVPAASARLPGDTDAVWLDDLSTFDVTMPAAARTSLVVTVKDEGYAAPSVPPGKTMDQGPQSIIVDVPQTHVPTFVPTYTSDGGGSYQLPVDVWRAQVDEVNFANAQAASMASNASSRLVDERDRAHFSKFMEYFPKKYEAKMNWVRAIAGIPPKSDASGAGSPCWRDFGDPYWWEDVEGFYLPAFTNHPYISARRLDDGSIISTREFGFGLVTQCDHRLKEGDRITIKIGGTNSAGAWAEGDRFVIPLIGAANAPLTGGANGDPTHTWTVRSSVLGALTDWAWLPSAPTPWAHAPATVNLAQGGIPFEVGDVIAFDIEGGQLRWRRDGGAWTTADLYSGAPLDLGDGLHLQAQSGAAPSFLAGDTWQFSAVATYGTARLRQPRIGQAFAWDGAACTLDVDLGSAQSLEAVMLAMHGIALDATVTVSGGLAMATEWTLPTTVRKGIILAVLPHTEGDPLPTARYLRIAVTGAGAGGAIGWLWAGVGWQPTVGPSRMTLKRQYGLARGAGINQSALYRGAGMGGAWAWDLSSGAALMADNAQGLLELIDHCAEQGLEPLALVPNIAATADASIALVDADEITMEEYSNWQDTTSRVVSLDLPLRAVLA